MQEHTIRPSDKSQLVEAQLTPEGDRAKKEAIGQFHSEEADLANKVESEKTFFKYAETLGFDPQHTKTVVDTLKKFKITEADILNTPKEEILGAIEEDVTLAIQGKEKEQKRAEQAQVEKEIDKNNSELAQTDNSLDSDISELSQDREKLTKEDKQLATREVVLSENIKEEVLTKDALIETVFTKIKPQNIVKLRERINALGLSDAVHDQAQKYIDKHEATLKSFLKFFKPNNPQEQAVFQNILTNSKLDLSAASNAEIYSDVFAQIDAGFAGDEDRKKELKESIAKQLGITVHKPEIKTGSDITQAIVMGYGADGNGNKVPYDKANKLQIIKGLEAYPEGNDLIMEAKVFGGRVLKFKTKVDDSNLTEKVNKALVIYLAEMKGLTSISHGQGFNKTQGGAVIDLSSGVMDDKASQFTKTVFRHYVGGLGDLVNQRLMTESEMEKIDWAFQWFHKSQGDLTGSDGGAEQNDSQQAKDGMVELGVMDKNDNLNEEQLKTALLYIQGQKIGGEPNFEQLRSFLNPGKDGDNEANSIE